MKPMPTALALVAAAAMLIPTPARAQQAAPGAAAYPGTFFYLAQPTLTSLTPTTGDSHGGTSIQVRGSGFLSGSNLEVFFGATKAHPMHFDHDLDLGAYLSAHGLIDAKSFRMRYLRSEFLGKRGVLVFERPGTPPGDHTP